MYFMNISLFDFLNNPSKEVLLLSPFRRLVNRSTEER